MNEKEKVAQIIQSNYRNVLVYKHDAEDFYTGSQLIVHEYEEALFFMNGQALDLFGPGRHTLETQNMPLVGKFFNRVTGDQTPFHCEVYFINKTEQMAIKWGTDSKVEYMEPTYGFPLKIGASGEMSIRVNDSRKMLLKIVGDSVGISQDSLIRKFRMFLMTRFKAYLAQLIKSSKINIFEIDEYLTVVSDALHESLKPDFNDYGVSLERFFVTTIVKPDGEKQFEKFRELHFRQYADITEARLKQQIDIISQQTQKEKMIIEAEGIATKRQLEGYSYQQERGFDVAERIAQNESTGEFVNLGVGMGMMTSVGDGIGGIMRDSLGNVTGGAISMTNIAPQKCVKCTTVLPSNAKFCLQCGEPVTSPSQSENSVVCSSCGKLVNKGNFCPECGNPVSLQCPNCGSGIQSGAKFCADCGHNLKEDDGHEG